MQEEVIMKYNSEQEVFDAVVKHAEQMSKQCLVDGFCMYRGKEGNKCLVGALIEDEDYLPEMDCDGQGFGIGVISLKDRGLLPEYLCEYASFLASCQYCHDNCPPNWKGTMTMRLKQVANDFNLQYTGVL